MSYQEQPRPNSAAVRAGREVVWPGSAGGFPAQEPTVTILFHGLQCFFFEGSRWCTVGLHNTTHARPHPQPHDYVVRIWKKVGGVCPSSPYRNFTIGNPKKTSKMYITAEGVAEGFEGVYVYQRDPFNRPEDPTQPNDPKDWRWAVDFDDLHEQIQFKSGTMDPGVTIDSGIFYTLRKTNSKFRLHPAGQPDAVGNIDLGSVAEILGANIYLRPPGASGEPGGNVTLTGGPFRTPEVLSAAPGITYQIDITNNCERAQHPPCRFDSAPHNPKEVRNDFYLYYKLFEPPPEPEYEMIITERVEPLDEFVRNLGVCALPEERAADDTPCGGVRFSGDDS